jgi:type II secretory pathway pseudopilin PulG
LHSHAGKRIPSNREYYGFTTIEIICTVAIFFLMAVGILKVYDSFRERDKQIRTRSELGVLSNMLEAYHALHGDYPQIALHNDNQGTVLNQALHGQIDPEGDTPPQNKQVDLVTTTLCEIDGKFVDPFSSDYIYYYKLRSYPDVWENPSYLLISKGPKGQQNPQRNLTISKGVTVSTAGEVTGNFRGDIIITNGGFL